MLRAEGRPQIHDVKRQSCGGIIFLLWPQVLFCSRCRPASYIAYLLGHEGGGSLLSLLIQRSVVNTFHNKIALLGFGAKLIRLGVRSWYVTQQGPENLLRHSGRAPRRQGGVIQ